MADGLLEVRGLSTGYGGVSVVHDVDLSVGAGEVVALLGPNGAGKTTTLSALSGLLPCHAGEVRFDGRTMVGSGRLRAGTAVRLVRAGIAHVPEDRCLFPDLTVAEHLRLGSRKRDTTAVDATYERFPALQSLRNRRAGLLSGGEQQMLALARALVARPRLLLVDELSLGLAPVIVQRLLPDLRAIADETGTGVLLVEQHVGLALAMADRADVLSRGRVVASGPATEIAGRPDLLEAGYFGEAPEPA